MIVGVSRFQGNTLIYNVVILCYCVMLVVSHWEEEEEWEVVLGLVRLSRYFVLEWVRMERDHI